MQQQSSREKVKLSSQSSLTNDQLTAHLTDEERNILEKVFLKEEEFHRQESALSTVAHSSVSNSCGSGFNRNVRRFSTRMGNDGTNMEHARSSPQPQRNMDHLPLSSPLESPSSSGTNTSTTSPCLLGCCRVCRKHIEVNEKYYYCDTCNQPVCEDCSSYSNVTEGEVSNETVIVFFLDF
jgi:hypothetical protein